MAYTIVLPVSGQPNSAALFGKAARAAILDLDARLSAIESFTNGKPMGRIAQTATQSINDNTDTAIQFPATDIADSHGFHDPVTNNSRVTPNVAGWYRIRGNIYVAGRTDWSSRACWIRKNGVGIGEIPGTRKDNLVNAINTSMEVITELPMNGSTDYFELIAYQDNAANVAVSTQVASQFASSLSWEYIRSLF